MLFQRALGEQWIRGTAKQAPPLPKKLVEINCRNFCTEEELTWDYPSYRDVIHMISVSQNGGDGFNAVSNPTPVFKGLRPHRLLLLRSFHAGA